MNNWTRYALVMMMVNWALVFMPPITAWRLWNVATGLLAAIGALYWAYTDNVDKEKGRRLKAEEQETMCIEWYLPLLGVCWSILFVMAIIMVASEP